MDGQPPVRVDLGQRGARLHIGVVLGVGLVNAFDDDVAFGPRRVDVAFADRHAPQHVAVVAARLLARHRFVGAAQVELFVRREILMYHRRVGRHGGAGGEDRRQLLVCDVDQP